MIETWPASFRPKSIDVHPVTLTQAGPRTLSGRQQRAAPDAGHWGLVAEFQVFTMDQLLDWRAMVAFLDGGLNSVRMGVFDERQAPTTVAPIDIALGADLALRATTARFAVASAGTLKRGMYFSIRNRLSVVTRPPEDLGGGLFDVTFWPPARAARSSGEPVEMANPRGTWRLADPKTGRLKLEGNYHGEPSLELEESFEGL